ncbi:Squamous cell carcinoma antigen recognized by T-cells 3 [Vitis vinifera]|uniref:Squamous cell carcinoma antigen recognized by T-cells 3 n=1 Tax=Vitis vinifera TaxID=29760 RepID=A0A438JA77_VITVI|nr:Squamous cell carcinoma antigen recognized by T-cells 3 [Vitis vinifera]
MAEASDSEMGSPENEALISAAQNPSSSDSDSDSDVGEAEELLRIQTLESEVSSDPSKYDAHVEYIKCLRKLGEIEKLREAREAMSALHPLTPLMWQEWARDELTARPEAFLEIEKLYEKGVFDYLSVPLWCDYLNFVQEHDPAVRECSSEGILKARNLFERALTAAGLHVAEGSKIWEVYREFEQAILLTIDENDNEAKEKQVQRIRNIFHRQLSVPLANMRSTLLAFKAWEVEQGNVLDVNSSSMDGISSHVASAYEKAMDMYDARAHLEEQIVRQDISDSERHQQFLHPSDGLGGVCLRGLSAYTLYHRYTPSQSKLAFQGLILIGKRWLLLSFSMEFGLAIEVADHALLKDLNYLNFEQSSGDPARVQILYERAITEFPVSRDLWLDYTQYLDKTLKVANVVRDVYSRAVKNCPGLESFGFSTCFPWNVHVLLRERFQQYVLLDHCYL